MPTITGDKNIFMIEDYLTAILNGDTLRNALDYVAYLKKTGMSVETSDSNVFDIEIGSLSVYPVDGKPGWTLYLGNYDSAFLNGKCQNVPTDEKLKNFAWEHVKTCHNFKTNGGGCGCGSQPGKKIMLFGKDFDNVCTFVLEITNPGGETLELAKQLAHVWKQNEINKEK